MRRAKGYLLPNGDRAITLRIDPDTFDEIAAGAERNGCTFSAQALMLIEVGLETVKEDRGHG